MASSAFLGNFQQNGISVAVDKDIVNILHVSGRLPLQPEFLAASAPVTGLLSLQGHFQAFPVHPGHHQHFSGFVILNDCRNQPFFIEFDGLKKAFLQVLIIAHQLVSLNIFYRIVRKFGLFRKIVFKDS